MMKILKPGKVEMRKFVCPNCECEFVIYKSEADRSIDFDANYHYWAKCPCRDQIAWDDGEPYKKPTPTQSDRERLDRLLIPWTESNSLRGYCVEHLINSGVTFREDAP